MWIIWNWIAKNASKIIHLWETISCSRAKCHTLRHYILEDLKINQRIIKWQWKSIFWILYISYIDPILPRFSKLSTFLAIDLVFDEYFSTPLLLINNGQKYQNSISSLLDSLVFKCKNVITVEHNLEKINCRLQNVKILNASHA